VSLRILAVSHPCVTDVNQQFYAELEDLGHEVQLIVPSNFKTIYSNGSTAVSRWPDFDGMIEQRRVGFSGSIPLHYYQSDLRPVMQSFRPDVLFAEEEPYSVSAWQAFYASRGMPMKRIVYSAQNILKNYPLPFRWMERYVLSRADAAAVVSPEVGGVLRQKRFAGAMLPFPLGVNTRQFRPSPEDRERLRKQLGLSDRFVIGYVGRFVEEKGLLTIIESLPYLMTTNIAFLCIGKGPLEDLLRTAADKYPEVLRIADNIPHRDIHKWMNAMDVLTLPSISKPNWREQFGRVIVEAMACGVPVIGSSCGEIPALIEKTGGGWVFPEGDVNRFVSTIRLAAGDMGQRLVRSRSGQSKVHTSFSKQSLAVSFEEMVQRMIQRTEMKGKAQ
jgi:glycosyltransferase involved in cell wall biosynthesis